MDLYKKLLKVQSELKAPKNQYNSFGKYKYRSCEDIVEGVKPLLLEHGVVMTISDDLQKIGEHYYIKATVTIIDIESDDKYEVNGFAREAENKKGMDEMQLTGATSSYARKYALNGMFSIDDTKDADSTNTHSKTQKPTNKRGKPASNGKHHPKLTGLHKDILNACNRNEKKVKPVIAKYYKENGIEIKSLSDLSKLNDNQAEQLLKKIATA